MKIMPWTDRRAKLVLLLAGIVYVALFSGIAAWKLYNFRYNALDLAIFTQTVSQTAAGNWFGNSIHPPTYLGDHFSPALALVALPFKFFPTPLTLLVLLQIALAAGAWPVYRLARHRFAPLPAAAVGVAYLLNPFTQNLGLFEFHFIAFAVPPLLFAAAAYQRQRFGAFTAWCLAAVFIREDVALVLVGFALLALLERRSNRWVLAPGIFGVLWLAGALALISRFAPAGSYKFGIYYAWLGGSPAAILGTLLTQPARIIVHLISVGNFEMIAGLLLPFCFLPLFAPLPLLLVAGPLAQILLGEPGGSDLILKTQYSALFLPGLWLAFTAALAKLRDRRLARPQWLAALLAQRGLRTTILAIAVVYAALTLGPLAGTVKKIRQQGFYPAESRWRQALVAAVPPEAPVAATYDFLPIVAARTHAASLNYAFIGRLQLSQVPYELPPDTEYIVADRSEFLTYQLQYRPNFLYRQDYPHAAARLRQRLEADGFGIVAAADRFMLLRRGAGTGGALYRQLEAPPPEMQGTPSAVGGGLHFLGFRRTEPAPGPILPQDQLPLATYWQSDGTPGQNYSVQLQVDGHVLPTYHPLGSGLYPVPDWDAGRAVETTYWFAKPAADAKAQIALQVVAVLDGGLYLAPDLSTEARVTRSVNLGQPIPLGTLDELLKN